MSFKLEFQLDNKSGEKMPYKPKILAFAGSLRKDSYNKKLVKIAAEGANKAGADVTYIDFKDYPMPIYDADIETASGIPANAQKFKDLMITHDGFLISAPEYNSSISGVLKNAIDWASRLTTPDEIDLICFKNKVIALMSASPGYWGGQRGLVTVKSIFGNIGSLILPQQMTLPNASQAFNAEGKLIDEKKQKQALELGANLANFLSKLHASDKMELARQRS
jgi:chromate reductase, NAD(P)H dehydrogenase (quinone)